MRQVIKLVTALGVAALVLVGFSGAAGAQYPPGEEVLEFEFPSQVQSGGTANVDGNCTIEGEDVVFTLGDDEIGTVTPDEDGNFSATLDIPSLSAGTYTLTGRCGPDLTAEGEVQVLAANQTPNGDNINTGSTPLARTGFDARPVATLGAAALILGGAAVYGSRRRRSLA